MQTALAHHAAVLDVAFPPRALPHCRDFSEVMNILAVDAPLKALDVGTGASRFGRGLAETYPGCFEHAVCIDIFRHVPSPAPVRIAGTLVETRFDCPYERVVQDSRFQHYFNVLFFNCPSDRLWPECLQEAPALLAPGGMIVINQRIPMFALEHYNAFDEPSDVAAFYHEYAEQSVARYHFPYQVIPTIAGYPPGSLETIVEGLIVARP